MLELRIGKQNVFAFVLVQWPEGRALLPAEDGAAAAPAKEKARVFSWNPKTGAINRWHGEQKRAET